LGSRKVKKSITPGYLPKPDARAIPIEINIIGIWKFLMLNGKAQILLEMSRLHPNFSLHASKKSFFFG
jgi:hypothetical protein